MTHTNNRCINCEIELDVEDYHCSTCGKSDIEEIHTCECSHCGWQEEQNTNDPCPQCGEEMHEYDE